MSNEEAARAFREIAALLDLKGESPFQVRAYERAADTIERADDLVRLAREGKLTELPGIGKSFADKIGYFVATGSIPLLEELRRAIPPGVVELSRIAGLGPSRVRAVRETLGIESVEEMERAMEDGRLADVKGIGPKVLEDLRKGILLRKEARGLRLHGAARREAETILALLRDLGAREAAIAGDLARWIEVVRDIVVVASCPAPGELLRAAESRIPGSSRAEDTLHLSSASGLPARVRAVLPGSFGAALAIETGSPGHLEALGLLAETLGLRLERSGLLRDGHPLPAPDEGAFYAHLGLPLLPPEVREGTGEIEIARNGPLPRLLERRDILGVVHVHSTWSDGTASIGEMADKAASLGFAYLAIADHSRSAGYAGGLSPERLLAQGEEIRNLNRERTPFRIFHGIESDILADGSLDYADEILETLDFVVSSVHSRFRLPREEQTARIVAALRSPYTSVLGHPSGRLLLTREPYAFDSDAVWRAASETGTAVELNAHEERLDVDWREIARLRELGVPVWIGSDAHAPGELEHLDLAVHIARKGWLGPGEVWNALPPEAFAETVRRKRS